MILRLGMIEKEVQATAEFDGWWLRPTDESGTDLSSRRGWPPAALMSPAGASASIQVEMLLDLDIAEAREGSVTIPWERFGDSLKEDIGLPLRWTTWSPLVLSIDRISEIGRPNFRYKYTYRLGARETAVERVGYFVRRRATSQVYHLDEQTFALVDSMDRFNALPEDRRTRENAWLTFATVKGCSESVGAALDRHLASNDVLVPSQIGLHIYAHEDGSISFVPKVDGLPEQDFREAFLRNTEVRGLYDVDGRDGKRVRVVLTDRQQQVLARMQQVRHARGADREQAERNPAQFFEGLLDAVEIEYGPRVVGIGDLTFASIPSNPSEGGGFFEGAPEPAEGPSTEDRERRERERPTSIKLPAGSGDGDVRLTFERGSELEDARARLAEALGRGEATAILKGVEIAASQEALDGLNQSLAEAGDARRTKGRKYLLIYTDEEDTQPWDVEAADRASQQLPSWPSAPVLPRSLRPDVKLKPHQAASLLWLQRCAMISDRRGVLLADDMGLGKTLQVLTYLAGRIEQGHLKVTSDSPENGPPWRPILIVAPLILVENETWVSEMRQFFKHDGDIFQPVLVLRGSGIDRVRADGARGNETVIGRPILDAGKLMQYRVVITNYETVVNYQHSLAQLHQGRPLWSAIVTDEAQKYKALNTKISVALKAIAADLHIASTGTPVENRLLDLWNIMDTLQPALLGTASEFSATYEKPLNGEESGHVLDTLRRRLLFQEPHSYLVRRTKDELLDLPPKHSVLIRCEMSPAERIAHADLLSVLGRERKAGRHLAVLQRLARLYQHPALLSNDWEQKPVAELLSESSKLHAVIEQLHRIRARGEKTIIFARHLDAQQLLSRVIGEEFQIRVPVINGSTSRATGFSTSSSGTSRARNERKRILDEFRSRPGFGVIILSPFVAGIGLTITEANHVIHYGRWWNPAVESQATDRAYRIGQTKNVSVYLPILHDPTGAVRESFDECLDQLLKRKYDLARDFLQPAEQEEMNASELCNLLERQGDGGADDARPLSAEALDRLGPYEFEAAVAALLQAEGCHVVLSPKGNDGGADVIAIKKGTMVVVQAKHSGSRTPVDDRALNDVLAACDLFTSRVGVAWRGMVVSNAPLTPGAVAESQRLGIETIWGEQLARRVAQAGIGWGEIAVAEASRAGSLNEVFRRARELVQSQT